MELSPTSVLFAGTAPLLLAFWIRELAVEN